jgi:hypothetical protein
MQENYLKTDVGVKGEESSSPFVFNNNNSPAHPELLNT